MVLDSICPPALIYILFSLTQVIIDTSKGSYNVAFVKAWVAIVITILLNYLCESGLGIISWFIVFVPFILMTVIISMILLVLRLDPITGKPLSSNIDIINKKETDIPLKPIDPRAEVARSHTTHVKKSHAKHKQHDDPDVPGASSSSGSSSSPADTIGGYFDNYNDANVNTVVKELFD